MARITPVSVDQAGDAAATFTSIKAKIGSVPNIYATMAQSPAVLDGFLAFTGALGSGVLDARTREQIALTVAGVNECDYCASAHTLMAKGAGLDDSEAALGLTGKATDVKTNAILAFTSTVVDNRGVVEDHVVDALRAEGVTDAELVEILAHIGVNLFTNYFNHIAGTDIDFPFVSSSTGEKARVA